MSTVFIAAERLIFALDQIKSTDGALWEAFANSFLSSDFSQLRPVGGIHDSGRDAFLYEAEGETGVYIQHSVQETFETKIRDTLETLQAKSFNPRSLIYCSPRDIIKKCEPIKRELRLKGVALDVRDRGYFVSLRNDSAGRVAASEDLAKKLADPHLGGVAATASIPHALTDHEEKMAVAYFQISLPDRASEKSVSKLCYETLVKYALREASPENPAPIQSIIAAISRLVPNENKDHLAEKVRGSITRLVTRGVVKHHTHSTGTNGYTLSKLERTLQQQHVQKLVSEVADLLSEIGDITSRIAEANEIDYSFNADHVARDVLMLCDYFLLDMGRGAAKAFESKEFFNPATTTLSDFAAKLASSSVPLASFKELGLGRVFKLGR